MLVEGVQPCLVKPNKVKVFYFCKCYSAHQSLVAVIRLLVCLIVCVYIGVVVCGGGGVIDGHDNGCGDGSGGDMGLPLEVGGLLHFQTMRVETCWSRNTPVLLY